MVFDVKQQIYTRMLYNKILLIINYIAQYRNKLTTLYSTLL